MSGGAGAVSLEDTSGEGGSAEWRRIYDRLEALLPQVEELAAGRVHLEAANKAQRECALEARLRKAEASRKRWKAAYRELSHDASGKLAALQKSDLEDSSTHDALFLTNNSQEKGANHEDIARDLRAELRKLKQACETLSSNKDNEVSALGAVRDFLWNQLRTIDKENMALLKIKEVESAQATEAAQKLQQKIEELEMAAQIKDDVIDGLKAENKETSNKRPRLCSNVSLPSLTFSSCPPHLS